MAQAWALLASFSVSTLFTDFVKKGNVDPLSPADIVGNNVKPGVAGNPFDKNLSVYYQVTILNNTDDQGFDLDPPIDSDGIIIIHSTGYGPDQTVAVVELKVLAPCIQQFCEREYAQRNVTSRNDANAACSSRITSSTLRSFTP